VFKRRKPDETSPTEIEMDANSALPPPIGPAAGQAAEPPSDTGLGVPPFRPAPPPSAAPVTAKEPPAMGRAPFSPSPLPMPQPPAPSQPVQAQAQVRPPAPARQPAERRTLVVGRGISLQGVVQDAERLVVEGTVEATMIHAAELMIAPGGVFKGEVEVEEAEVAGTIDGTLTARGNLIVRATGRVLGTARCRRLQVEDGGQITGRMEMLTEGARAPDVARAEMPA